ncbi:ACP S-malonyltransferase [Streptomyces sp. NPDC057301]|uniref:ACP S-malonyltransferase n=1 Tax=Streptomyces sp. NPDC057301 TaxID=3346093 RepID=UPI0036272054
MPRWYGCPQTNPEGRLPQSTSSPPVRPTALQPDSARPVSRGGEGSLWVFAGQGSQQPHMGNGLADAPALFERVRRAVGFDLANVCTVDHTPRWDQPVLQAAILTVATASARACRSRGSRPGAVLGHSFGDYAALVVAESLSFDDAIRLAVTRGQAMADLANGSTAMAAVIGATNEAVAEVCEDLLRSGLSVHVASYNSPGQTVLGGTREALAIAARRMRAVGATRMRTLSVPFAAHTPHMKTVQERLARALEGVHVDPPSVPFYSSVTGHQVRRPDELRDLLVRSVTEPVQFRQATVRALSDGYDKVLEVGSDWPPRLLGFINEICRRDLPEWLPPFLCSMAADSDAPDGRPFTPRQERC